MVPGKKKVPPKKSLTEKPALMIDLPPVEVPSPFEVEKPRKKRGTKRGQRNWWEWSVAMVKAGMAAVAMTVATYNEAIIRALPQLKGYMPQFWIGVLFCGTILIVELNREKNTDNSGENDGN